MRILTAFSAWLRANAEHYLLRDAQGRIAATYGAQPPRPPKGLKERFWLQVFTPVYRLLPWSFRRTVMQAMPGSHRRDWPAPDYSRRPPGV